jgi:hypothetical protein
MSTLYWQDSASASYIPTPGGTRTVRAQGGTVYFKSTSDVTSSDHDGSVASGEKATFDSPQYVITAQGETAQLLILP